MDRFNFDKPMRDFINAAVGMEVVDAVDILAIALDYAVQPGEVGWQEWLESRLVHEILEAAFNNRHSMEGVARHKVLCTMRDQMG
jgi:hypothetical protein